ncbi:Zinc finger protein 341 [Anthophora retusa]
MVKMAHASLPNLICKPINSTKMCPTDFNTTISDVLQSEPVKRLFSQPNIIIKAVPLKLNTTSASNNNVLVNKINNIDSNLSKPKQSELSVIPLQLDQEGNVEDENLLPSKKQGKSEITLVPIKKERKPCGHYESCESIVCDVAVQQYVDSDGLSPMLAVNIEENEINAPVSKHCANAKCDALSIDHDRCRRAVIRLNRCNQSTACDICGITLKTQRSRIHHKNCKRRNEYRHNEINGAQILKERMREREIQMMEASKAKKNDYTDPVTGYNLAMETLRNNEELIIIPKTVHQQQQQQQQQSTINITPISTNQSTLQINNSTNVFGKFLPTLPLVLPQQSIVLGKTQCFNENSITTPIQVALSNTLNGPLLTTNSTVPLPQNPYVTFTAQTNTHPIQVNDLLLSQSQIVTTPIQPKPLLTPIRVVPITNLITQPSLLHQIQGIPKFCIMPDNTVSPLTITNPQPVQQPTPVPKVDVPSDLNATSQKKKKSSIKKKRKLKKKDLKCSYCLKSFSTHWYFKMHVARHTGEKRFCCKICSQSFNNSFDLKEHMSSEHNKESIPSNPNICDQEPNENAQAKVNLDIHQELKKEDNKTNGYVCLPNQDIVKNIKTELCHEV